MKNVAWGRVLSIHLGAPAAIPFLDNVDFIRGESSSDETLAIVCRNCADLPDQVMIAEPQAA